MHSWIEVAYSPIAASPQKEKISSTKIIDDRDVQLISPDIEFGYNSKDQESEDENSPIRVQQNKPDIEKIILYIQMELCQKTLEDYIVSDPPWDYEERLKLAYQLVKALNVIHTEYNIIHRDITPKNIFFAKDGSVKIGDFGLATNNKNFLVYDSPSPFISPVKNESEENLLGKISDLSIGDPYVKIGENMKETDEKQKLTNGIGTKEYASPEQMSDKPYDQRTDIYSLGLILLSLFNPTTTQSERYDQLRKCRAGILPSAFLEKYSPLATLIKSMTSKDPINRLLTYEILKHPLFMKFRCECEILKSPQSSLSHSNGSTEDEEQKDEICQQNAMVMIGKNGRPKQMFVKVSGGKLLGYKRPDKKKAKFCYPLAECKIQNIRRVRAILDENESEPIIEDRDENETIEKIDVPIEIIEKKDNENKNNSEIVVSHDVAMEICHPELRTLYLMINEGHILVKEILAKNE